VLAILSYESLTSPFILSGDLNNRGPTALANDP
jgi:hypothetical protein